MTASHWALVGPKHKVNLAAPDFTHIPWLVIVRQLCNIPRFNGAFGLGLLLSGHSIHVADMLPARLRLYGLLHDAHEGPMGDIIRPTRRVLNVHWQNHSTCPQEADPIEQLEMRCQIALFAKAGLQWPPAPDDMEALQKADDAVGACEMQHGRAGTLDKNLIREHRTPSVMHFHVQIQTALFQHQQAQTEAHQMEAME